jgi:hypothetical protein
MADEATPTGETTETPTGESTETTSTETTETKVVDHEAEAAKWKSLSRKWEKQAKDNGEAAKKLKEIEDAQKSESERNAEKLTALERSAQEATLEAARLRVAIKKGLTETQAKRLVGKTEEELEADADELLSSFKPSDSKDDSTKDRRPKERLKPGATPSSEPDEMDPRKLAAQVPQY